MARKATASKGAVVQRVLRSNLTERGLVMIANRTSPVRVADMRGIKVRDAALMMQRYGEMPEYVPERTGSSSYGKK